MRTPDYAYSVNASVHSSTIPIPPRAAIMGSPFTDTCYRDGLTAGRDGGPQCTSSTRPTTDERAQSDWGDGC